MIRIYCPRSRYSTQVFFVHYFMSTVIVPYSIFIALLRPCTFTDNMCSNSSPITSNEYTLVYLPCPLFWRAVPVLDPCSHACVQGLYVSFCIFTIYSTLFYIFWGLGTHPLLQEHPSLSAKTTPNATIVIIEMMTRLIIFLFILLPLQI